MGKLLTLALLIWGFFSPGLASWVFIGLFTLFEIFVAVSHWSGRGVSSEKLSADENHILQRYNLYLRYPFVSKGMSSTLSTIGISAFIWVPLLIWKSEYPQAVVIALNYIPSGILASWLNPRLFLSKEASKKDGFAKKAELIALDNVIEKIHGYNPSKDSDKVDE